MVRRLAFEILERNRGADNLTVLGILQRGDEVGRAIVSEIEARESTMVVYHALDVSAWRDDTSGDEVRDVSGPDLTDRDVILVDDVLFTGRTVRAALDAVVSLGRPRSIQLTVLVDRGHREFPIQPDFVGRRIPTKHRERVEVTLGERPSVDVVE
ncbi:MAG: bifunctional pyr operon transcriptional regulator/uracil phosphoribosyltransferase PyrR [Rhodothermales bacterium]|nr:bifunctional pyr operon transcriptional regulator/uracil phosphoribosyltransferase PyrR [Rhodothermales bacterium]MBO6779125.1 bifunctional pyr operon transcriptional regulator/uracil phosphoribosyltransferase PyrR [Rhodothermales bacterium]